MKRFIVGAPKKFFDIIARTWRHMSECDVQILAGSLAFATVISLVPLLAVSLSVFKAFGGFENLMTTIEPFIMQNFVEASGAQISKFIRNSIQRIHSGALGIGGAIALLVTSTKLFLDVETAIKRVWRERDSRSLLRRLVVWWIVMFLGPLVLAVSLGLIGSKDLGLVRMVPKGTIALVFSFIAFFCLNKYVPQRKVSYFSAILSSLLTSVAIALAQTFYARITKDVLRYSKIYGSLASIPIFLLWILVLWWICLAGVALCATLEERRFPQASKMT